MSATPAGPPALRIGFQQIFAAEIEQAKRRGFVVQVSLPNGAAAVRLMPFSERAKTAARRAAPELPEPLIEAACALPEGGGTADTLDAVRDALREALRLAKDSGA